MPERAPAGEACSLHADVHGKTGANQPLLPPKVARDDLPLGIEYGVGKRKLCLPVGCCAHSPLPRATSNAFRIPHMRTLLGELLALPSKYASDTVARCPAA
jgi:hypothetical protein